MAKRKKPKYNIGEMVVIKAYGTVGKITDIKWMDGNYIYEINKNEGLFIEERLQLLSEYEDKVIDKEHIDIEYKFFFGDIVQVNGYSTDLFKIVGFRTEIWRYKEDAWEDVIYELSRISDGEWLEAGEDELTMVAEAENAEKFIQKLGYLYNINNQTNKLNLPEPKQPLKDKNREKLITENHKINMIDHLLDIYNDYQILAKMFQDPEYEKVQKLIIQKLKKLSK